MREKEVVNPSVVVVEERKKVGSCWNKVFEGLESIKGEEYSVLYDKINVFQLHKQAARVTLQLITMK